MEFAPLAAVGAGGDARAAQAALVPWFILVLLTGAVTFAVGVLAFAMTIARSAVLGPRPKWFVVGALIVLALARVVPLSAVQLYVQGLAGIAALWPLAYAMWKHPEGRSAAQPHPVRPSGLSLRMNTVRPA